MTEQATSSSTVSKPWTLVVQRSPGSSLPPRMRTLMGDWAELTAFDEEFSFWYAEEDNFRHPTVSMHEKVSEYLASGDRCHHCKDRLSWPMQEFSFYSMMTPEGRRNWHTFDPCRETVILRSDGSSEVQGPPDAPTTGSLSEAEIYPSIFSDPDGPEPEEGSDVAAKRASRQERVEQKASDNLTDHMQCFSEWTDARSA